MSGRWRPALPRLRAAPCRTIPVSKCNMLATNGEAAMPRHQRWERHVWLLSMAGTASSRSAHGMFSFIAEDPREQQY